MMKFDDEAPQSSPNGSPARRRPVNRYQFDDDDDDFEDRPRKKFKSKKKKARTPGW